MPIPKNLLLLPFYIIDENAICVGTLISAMDTNARQCNCGVDCEEINYDMIPSSSEFPAENYKVIVQSHMILQSVKLHRSNTFPFFKLR